MFVIYIGSRREIATTAEHAEEIAMPFLRQAAHHFERCGRSRHASRTAYNSWRAKIRSLEDRSACSAVNILFHNNDLMNIRVERL